MGNPFQGIPLPPRAMRKATRRTRATARGLVTDYATLETTDFTEGIEDVEIRSSPPLACGHIVSKKTPYLGTCSICGITEFCERCQLQCNRCHTVGFRCCLVLYRPGDGSEAYYCPPCRRKVRWRRFVGRIAEAFKHPFVVDPPPNSNEE